MVGTSSGTPWTSSVTFFSPTRLVRQTERPGSAPRGLPARERDGNVAHGGIGLGAVPMALTRFHVSRVTDLDLEPLGFRGDPPAARGDDENLVTIVNMPARVAPLAEIHDATNEMRRLSGLDDGLAGAMHGAGISIRRFCSARGGDFWDILQRNDLHDTLRMIEVPAVPSAQRPVMTNDNATGPAGNDLAGSRD